MLNRARSTGAKNTAAPADGSYALECRGLAKRFGAVPAVQELDLTVAKGQIVALLGPSGCGKTTTLRLIAGFDRPDAGAMRISGRVACDQQGTFLPPESRRVGMVFQEGALFPHLTVWQNVAYGLPQSQGRAERVQEVLGLVGLAALGHRMPHELSGGQQQRVALARALAPQPELLLLDEPFSNLDPSLRQQVRHDVREILRASNSTAIFVTHDQDEALSMGDVVGVMNQGRIEQLDSPEELFHHPATRFVAEFIGMADFIPGSLDGSRLLTEAGSVPWPQAAPGGPVDVMVRPDCLDCVPAPKGQGVITDREFRGAFYLYRVALPSGSTVRCLLSHTDEFPVGAAVTVSLRHGHDLRPFVQGIALAR
ncbi:MAG: ABC transporter ATP-binding protein [Dehalococcoidia bacterium]|nr:ABC transporter ATP-binding protein [Dehalococcoidia bacterium]MSQ16827.1 ABC transporter ATP-binding protein [Dehalococcoidia bacterium]